MEQTDNNIEGYEENINNINKEIQVLEHMNSIQSNTEIEQMKKDLNTPVRLVESALADFVNDAFNVTREDFDLGRALKDSLIKDLEMDALNPAQKIALFSAFQVNTNDRISKVISPAYQLMATRQQAEIAAAAQMKNNNSSGPDTQINNITALNQSASKEVIQGMTQLNNLLTSLMKGKDGKKEEAISETQREQVE